MSRQSDEEKTPEYLFEGHTLSQIDLTVLGYSPAMAKGQDAISLAMSNGRVMQNAVPQAVNAQTTSQARTMTGVATVLTRKRRMKRKKNHKEFLRAVKAL